MPPPFVILGTPRSRTTWLASVLSYGGWECLHEPSIGFRSLDDLRDLLDRPRTGSADSLMTLLWRDIARLRPDTRVVVVRRPVGEVVESFRRAGHCPPGTLEAAERADRAAELASRLPGALSIAFKELSLAPTVQRIAWHATGSYLPPERIFEFEDRPILCDIPAKEAALAANAAGFEAVFGPHLGRPPAAPRCLVVVVNRPAYRIAVEELFGLTFGHVEFSQKATPAILRACRKDIDAVIEMHGGPMHAMPGLITDPKEILRHTKFMALMGFTVLSMQPCIDGVVRPLYFRRV